MTSDWSIVVPSRARPGNIPTLLKLIPEAYVCVDRCEKTDYAEVVPKGRLLLHPGLDRLSAIRNWILDNAETESVVMCDDDLKSMHIRSGRLYKKVVDPVTIHTVFANGARILADLDLSLYSWSRNPNPIAFDPTNVIKFCNPAAGVFVVRGRKFRWDENLTCRVDCDFTMSVLRGDRISFSDNRFYFNFGAVCQGKGGLQGRRTSDREAEELEYLNRKWGDYLKLGGKSRYGNNGMSVKVPRKMANHTK